MSFRIFPPSRATLLGSLLLSLLSTGCVALIPVAERNRENDLTQNQCLSCKEKKALRSRSSLSTKSAALRKAESLLEQTYSPSAATRTNAVSRLGDYGSNGTFALPRLIELSRVDESYWVRRASVKSLAKIGSPEVIPPLKRATKDRDKWVAHSATRALASLERK